MFMNKKTRENGGITLIALVVTIIVLLILAGTSIAMLTGDNGILTRANDAKREEEIAYIKEQAKSDISNWIIEKKINNEDSTITISILRYEILKDKEYIEEYTEDGKAFFDKNGNIIQLEDLCDLTEEKFTAKIVSYNYSIFYGKYVNYELDNVNNDVRWKIFYADTENIYLIADNFIEYDNIPDVNGNKLTRGDQTLSGAAYFNTNVFNTYSGSDDITTDYSLRKWVSKFYENETYISTESNMKCTAYMLDTTIWNKFTNNSADYTIGSPTLEMFVASYNQVYPNKTINIAVPNNFGYDFNWNNFDYNVSSISNVKDYNGLYLINNSQVAKALWIASPARSSQNSIVSLTNDGRLNTYYFNYGHLGFRPVICLNKDVELEFNENENSYNIKIVN